MTVAYAKTKSGVLIPSQIAREYVQVRRVSAKYDAAQTNVDNMRHWANSDSLSVNAANSVAVRTTIRNRSRYEVANNSYAKGMVLTLANDLIGSGPRIQVLTGNASVDKFIEREFSDWCQEIRIARKLRTMRMAKSVDGEAFAVMGQNYALESPVKFDLKLYESEQIANPMLQAVLDDTDGIIYDDFGNPVAYYLLSEHPGSTSMKKLGEYETIKAQFMIHWFREDRPGQNRGISELTPCLNLFGQQRRYTLAVIAAAETAADIALVIQSAAAPGEEDPDVDPMDVFELEKRQVTTLPKGYQLGQTKAEQPTTTYSDFKWEILGEVGRCQNMPINVVMGNSSKHNYASGRLDHQVYYKSLRVERADLELIALDRIFNRWFAEARLIEGYLPKTDWIKLPHQWFWDGNEHVDPQKEANAQDMKLKNGSTNLEAEYGKGGKDWQVEVDKWTNEIIYISKKLGITPAEYLKLSTSTRPQAEKTEKGNDNED